MLVPLLQKRITYGNKEKQLFKKNTYSVHKTIQKIIFKSYDAIKEIETYYFFLL